MPPPHPTHRPGIALTAAAAVLVGGTSFVGGSGGVFGTFLGALFLGVVSNGLIISGTSAYWQGIIAGTVLIVAVFDRPPAAPAIGAGDPIMRAGARP